jgi:hypothetical protein
MTRKERKSYRKGKRKDRNIHHRRPKSRGGSNHPSNLSNVKVERHQLWHAMFGNKLPQAICEEINRTWLDGRYYVVLYDKKTGEPI